MEEKNCERNKFVQTKSSFTKECLFFLWYQVVYDFGTCIYFLLPLRLFLCRNFVIDFVCYSIDSPMHATAFLIRYGPKLDKSLFFGSGSKLIEKKNGTVQNLTNFPLFFSLFWIRKQID